jgi:hypothetical protein
VGVRIGKGTGQATQGNGKERARCGPAREATPDGSGGRARGRGGGGAGHNGQARGPAGQIVLRRGPCHPHRGWGPRSRGSLLQLRRRGGTELGPRPQVSGNRGAGAAAARGG